MVTDKVTQAILICQKTSQSGILSTSLRMVHGKFKKKHTQQRHSPRI